jgi:PAS domain S-box-containing protein
MLLLAAGGWLLNRRLVGRVARQRAALQAAQERIAALESARQARESAEESLGEKLRRYLKLMDSLINAIPAPIYFKDYAGVFQGCNQAFAEGLLALPRERIIGSRLQELTEQIPPDLAAVYQREELRMIARDGRHSFEAQARCADGTRRDYLFSLAPVAGPDGTPGGYVAVMSDLTEKNRWAQEQLQREKLQGVLETAGGVCHEINQPLQALSGYAEMLAAQLKEAQARQYLHKIVRQVERIGSITARLQRITRYSTTPYGESDRVIDIERASEAP